MKQCKTGCAPLEVKAIKFPSNPMVYTYDVKNAFSFIDMFENGEFTDVYLNRADEFGVPNCRRCYYSLPMLRQTLLSASEELWVRDAQGSKRVPEGVAGCQLSINYSSTRHP